MTRSASEGRMAQDLDAWAIYYDFIHTGLDGEAEFYAEEAARHGGPAVELGCGTGRIAIPLALSGIALTGVDLSPAMLAICREKMAYVELEESRLPLIEADMRAFELDFQPSFIFMAYRTFMHLLTPESQRECLTCIYRHLAPGGRFAFNTWAARPSSIQRALQNWPPTLFRKVGEYPVEKEGLVLHHHYRVRYDEHEQRIDEDHRIDETDESGEVIHSEELKLRRSWQYPRELEHLLQRCGFAIEACHGGFDRSPFTAASTEMIWVCRKA